MRGLMGIAYVNTVSYYFFKDAITVIMGTSPLYSVFIFVNSHQNGNCKALHVSFVSGRLYIMLGRVPRIPLQRSAGRCPTIVSNYHTTTQRNQWTFVTAVKFFLCVVFQLTSCLNGKYQIEIIGGFMSIFGSFVVVVVRSFFVQMRPNYEAYDNNKQTEN